MSDRKPTGWEIVKRGVRSVAASFPLAASLAQAWNEYESHQWGERVEELFVNMRVELEALIGRVDGIEAKIDSVKEEFPSLVETAVDCVRREPAADRRRLFARCMVRLLVLEHDIGLSEKTALIRELDTLTDMDLKVLTVFSDKRGHQLVKEDWVSAGVGRPGLDQTGVLYGSLSYMLYGSLSKLEARGLLAGTPVQGGVQYVGDDGIPKNWSGLQRTMWALPRGLCLLRALSESDNTEGEMGP